MNRDSHNRPIINLNTLPLDSVDCLAFIADVNLLVSQHISVVFLLSSLFP